MRIYRRRQVGLAGGGNSKHENVNLRDGHFLDTSENGKNAASVSVLNNYRNGVSEGNRTPDPQGHNLML